MFCDSFLISFQPLASILTSTMDWSYCLLLQAFLWLHWAYPDNPGLYPHLNILNLITSAKTILACKVTYSGLGLGPLREASCSLIYCRWSWQTGKIGHHPKEENYLICALSSEYSKKFWVCPPPVKLHAHVHAPFNVCLIVSYMRVPIWYSYNRILISYIN